MSRNSLINTISGREFDFLNVTPAMIDIEDIAHALSMCCRFNGHVREFYSVAQHSYLGSTFVRDEVKLAFLLHDAAEAYLSDVITPVKRHLSNYAEFEENIQWAIARKFGFSPSLFSSVDVREADARMLITERNQLQPIWDKEIWSFAKDIQPYDVVIVPHVPYQAKSEFLAVFEGLRL